MTHMCTINCLFVETFYKQLKLDQIMNFDLKYTCYAKCRRSTVEPGVKLTLVNIAVTKVSLHEKNHTYHTTAYYKRSIKCVMQICNAMLAS